MKEEGDVIFYYCVVVLVVNSIVLYVYHFVCDPYKNIERYYYKSSWYEYYLFKLMYLIIFLSFVISAKYIAMEALRRFFSLGIKHVIN